MGECSKCRNARRIKYNVRRTIPAAWTVGKARDEYIDLDAWVPCPKCTRNPSQGKGRNETG